MDTHLSAFLTDKADPRSNIVEQASESQQTLRDFLSSKLENGEDLPDILVGQEFLFGSAIRGTKTKPYDDVDLMLILDGSALVPIEGGQVVGSVAGSGKQDNVLLSPRYLGADGRVSSQKIVQQIRKVLAGTYTRSTVRTNEQAINVWMESYGFGIDVVPAFKITDHQAGDHYYIAAGREQDGWMSTNPHRDIDAFEYGDTRLKGLLRPTTRLMRKWNELSNCERLSGFHVDALVYRALQAKDIDSLELGVLHCLADFENLLGTHCPQFSGFAPHIDHRLSEEDKRLSKVAVARAKDAIFSAMQQGQKSAIEEAWNNVFAGQLL